MLVKGGPGIHTETFYYGNMAILQNPICPFYLTFYYKTNMSICEEHLSRLVLTFHWELQKMVMNIDLLGIPRSIYHPRQQINRHAGPPQWTWDVMARKYYPITGPLWGNLPVNNKFSSYRTSDAECLCSISNWDFEQTVELSTICNAITLVISL